MAARAAQPRPRRRGYGRAFGPGLTLAELTVSLGVIATLMVATGSIMVITGRAVAMSATHAAEARTDDVATTIASDYRLAVSVIENTATSIAFTVADRDGDGVVETIRYSWSGTPGDSLMKQVNALPPVVVARDVRKFNLRYITRTVASAEPVQQVETTTDEEVYAHTSGTTSPYSVTMTNHCAQYFIPRFSRADATSWRVTQVQFMASRVSGSTTGRQWFVRLYHANADGTPNLGLGVIEEQTLQMSSLTTGMQWSPLIGFTKLDQNLDCNTGYCVVVGQNVVSTVISNGSVGYDGASGDANGVWSTYSSTSGWQSSGTRDMKIRVMGRYKYPAP